MVNNSFQITGRVVDVVRGKMFNGRVTVQNGRIAAVEECAVDAAQFILPGFIDAHVHIESSLLIPTEFARLAAVHGTVAVVCDPHEIANVLGAAGVDFMIANAKKAACRCFFGAPSCVPATPFESTGAELDAKEVAELLKRKEVTHLAEMMNFPGVLHGDPEVLAKLQAAVAMGKPVDGHAPGLRGADVSRYAQAGISTDHECFDIDEAREKIAAGMKVLIREGSAAKNFETLLPLLNEAPEQIMFCSDDKHPDDLVRGHINLLVQRALQAGYDQWAVLRAVSQNPIKHYQLPVGLLQPGDSADFIVMDDIVAGTVQETYLQGQLTAQAGKPSVEHLPVKPLNRFSAVPVDPKDLEVQALGPRLRVIELIPGELITREILVDLAVNQVEVSSDPGLDLLKLAVVNRYEPSSPALGFVRGLGLQRGAIASSVAHDSHNIVAAGCSDAELALAVNAIIAEQGGLVVVEGERVQVLRLPIAGIMASSDGYEVAEQYEVLDQRAKELGSSLSAPFMSLSFLALLVIPKLKLSDQGLFNGELFEFVSLFES